MPLPRPVPPRCPQVSLPQRLPLLRPLSQRPLPQRPLSQRLPLRYITMSLPRRPLRYVPNP